MAPTSQSERPAMIAGHFGFAAGVKAKAPSVPLWTLMLACQWLDVVFAVLFAAGIEGLEPIQGAAKGAYGAVIIHADYTHSLAGAALLSVLFGAVTAFWYGRVRGFILGLVVMSHWVIDLIVHRPDMPLLPGGKLRLGFGLWRYPAYSAGLELALVIAGAWLYRRAARRVAGANAAFIRRANLCGIAVFAAGAITLALNLLGY
jgi:hypothetical protein